MNITIKSRSMISPLKFKELFQRILLFTLFALTITGVNAKTIHWITFIDTDDQNVGEVDKNIRTILYTHFVDVVNAVIKGYGYNSDIYDFYGDNCTPTNCRDIINNIECDSTDIIVFYYVGHGLRSVTQTTKYPLLMFGSNNLDKAIPLTWIHNSLKQKAPRLLLTFSVGANVNGIDHSQMKEVLIPTITKIVSRKEKVDKYESSVANAFLGFKGDAIFQAAAPGQDSWSAQTTLGPIDIFTYSIIKCFTQMYSDNNFSWAKFIEEVSSETSKTAKEMHLATEQTPVYDYNLIQIQ